MDSFDDVLGQIDGIERELAELPADAFLQRIELRDRLLELRAEAGRLRQGADIEGPTEHLMAQLGGWRQELNRLRKQRIDVVKQGVETQIYPEVASGLGIPDVESQILRIEAILCSRGIENP